MKSIFICSVILFVYGAVMAQQQQNLVYVDKQGVLRWTKGNQEAAFFGVNYTVPFAYGYRSHKALNVDLEKAIDADVHHMWRMGLDAFRVHVWDVEISDSTGQLLDNDHLRLFDYLIKKLKHYNIKIFITPIAFWGNGYPERDEKTPGFATKYGKGQSVVLEAAIQAQEKYLEQFFKHVNPYTKLSYTDDPDIIAAEINNEPHHSGPKEKTTEYVNRMVAAVKKAGWKKPIFYNISESPFYADAIVKADVVGHSFQWYPSGLVAGREQKGNFLPNVDRYYIPFEDTIPAFKNRVKMVYEFDAADIMQPIMYPAMARSYRTAGFQWATQFAYDPLYTAYHNSEYQTHYLNLVYTPEKAISMLIAAKVFKYVPRLKSYGNYPADTLFGAFRVSYRQQLSEMNTDTAFYYTGTTTTQPKSVAALKHIAGTGSSPVVSYEGTGAYFLDKRPDGVWKLEVMPDAIAIRDPFERASPKKEVTRIIWRANKMQLFLPDLANGFYILAKNEGNNFEATVSGNSCYIKPGVYLIAKRPADLNEADTHPRLFYDFYAPPSSTADPFVVHQPLAEVSAGKTFPIIATITGIDSSAKVSVELRNSSNKWETVQMQRVSAYEYKAEVPVSVITPGMINYRILLQRGNEAFTFPGGLKGNPYAWDEYRNESWQTFVAIEGSPIELFNATGDRNKIMVYTPGWRTNTIEYTTTEKPRQLAVKATMTKPAAGQLMGWQFYFGDKVQGRKTELSGYSTVMIRARSEQNMKVVLSIITVDGNAYGVDVPLTTQWKEMEVPLKSLQDGSYFLLPRPYPGFLPLKFRSVVRQAFDITSAEKIEIIFGDSPGSTPVSIEVESVWLKK